MSRDAVFIEDTSHRNDPNKLVSFAQKSEEPRGRSLGPERVPLGHLRAHAHRRSLGHLRLELPHHVNTCTPDLLTLKAGIELQ